MNLVRDDSSLSVWVEWICKYMMYVVLFRFSTYICLHAIVLLCSHLFPQLEWENKVLWECEFFVVSVKCGSIRSLFKNWTTSMLMFKTSNSFFGNFVAVEG